MIASHRRLCAAAALFVAAVTATFAFSQNGPVGQQADAALDRDRWMHAKLSSSNEIFAGLTSGDFQKTEDNARRMLVLNFLEGWATENRGLRSKSAYQGQLNAFEFAVKEIVRHSQEKNLEGVLKSYVSLTESCVRCHQVVRDVAPGSP